MAPINDQEITTTLMQGQVSVLYSKLERYLFERSILSQMEHDMSRKPCWLNVDSGALERQMLCVEGDFQVRPFFGVAQVMISQMWG